MTSVCVTGVSGFVGGAIYRALGKATRPVRGAVRTLNSVPPDIRTGCFAVGDMGLYTDWSGALVGMSCVIHCAGRVNFMNEPATDLLAAYRAVNVKGTRRLAEQAAAAGVRRLVFLSSVKVNGEITDESLGLFRSDSEGAVSSNDEASDFYGVSKQEAEQELWEISERTGLQVVVVRPALVYGPGVKGNLARLLKLVRLGMPLPFGAVKNKRSLIGLDNLVDLVIRCVDHPGAVGQTFLASDGEDLSTPDLIRKIAEAMDRSPKLIPVPVSLLQLAGSVLGRRAEIDRLVGSLQIESGHTRQVLGWSPAVSVQEGIRRMVQGI